MGFLLVLIHFIIQKNLIRVIEQIFKIILDKVAQLLFVLQPATDCSL